jgi:hypothetical protein
MRLDGPVLVALAALAGSLVGAFSSVAATFIGQRLQARWTQLRAELEERENLYGLFVEEAVHLFVDAIQRSKIDPLKSCGYIQRWWRDGCYRFDDRHRETNDRAIRPSYEATRMARIGGGDARHQLSPGYRQTQVTHCRFVRRLPSAVAQRCRYLHVTD